MDFNAFVYRYEAKDVITRNGIAAISHFVIQFIFVFSKNQLIKFLSDFVPVNIFGFIRFPDSVFEEADKGVASGGGKFFQLLVVNDSSTYSIKQIQACFYFEVNYELVYSVFV